MVGQGAELPSLSPNGPPRVTRPPTLTTSSNQFSPISQHSSPTSQQIPIQSHQSPANNSTESFYPDSTYSSLEAGPSPPVLVRPEHSSPKLQQDLSPGHSCDNSPRPSRNNSPLLPRGKENLRSTSSAPAPVNHYIEYDTHFLSPQGTSENHESSSSDVKKKKNKKMRAAGKAMKHMLPNSNAKSREQDFHKLFKSLPDGETLIQDFSCALLRDILVQGRLYISQNWFCFYANILGWETLLTIEVKKIAGIKKEKTALVINNAISISTHEEKYFFSSFMSRDSAYAHMMRVWLPASDPSVAIPSVDSSTVGDDDKMSSDGYMSEDDDIQPSYPPLRTLVPPEHSTRGGGENVSFSQEDETCVCISHYANEHMNQDFDMNIEKMYKLLFNDDSSVQSKMKDLQKMTEYEVTSWTDSTEGANERTLNYMIPLNANLGPKFAEVVEKQVLTTNSVAAKCYIVNCEVNNPNVPYGDKFFIMKRYCLTRCSDNVCRLRMTSEVQYRKGVWGMVKSIIEKNSREGISEYCDDLCTCLTEESAGPGVKVRKSVPGSSRASSSRGVTRAVSQEQPTRATSATQFVSNNYIALILIMMAVLLMLNLILVYRLSSFTSQSCPMELLNSMPHSEEGKSEWVKILAKQQDLHKKEIERWQEVLRWISKLVSEVHVSLDKLQKSSIYITPPNTEL